MEKAENISMTRNLIAGLLLLFSSVPIAFLIHLINNAFPHQPEKAAMMVGVLFAILFVLPSAFYLLFRLRSANPWRIALVLIATISVLLASIYLYRVTFYVFFPADILLWSESDFVNDILKIRLDYPIYSAQVNNESYYYTPGTQILTYLVAQLLGNATSIPLYRVIQFCFVLLAAIVAASSCRKLLERSFNSQRAGYWKLWNWIFIPIFFLICTNPITNGYVYHLHHDALALLVSITAYWMLLEYVFTGKRRILALMAIIPAAGFFIKQSLVIWIPLYSLYLVFFHKPRSLLRLVIFILASLSMFGLVFGACYLLWGKHFIYWVFSIGKDGISPLRSFQHILDAWIYLVIGLLGGLMLLRGKHFSLFLGPWLMWLFLILVEGYTSGIGWMLNHIGPGSLIAGIWFLAALVRIWPAGFSSEAFRFRSHIWLRAGLYVAVICLIFSGLGFVRIPVKPLSDDAYRYVKEIEREFEGQDADQILLDAGTWIYQREGIIMKDRALPIANRGYNETGDFSGIIKRLKKKHYSKILVRNLHSPGFLYDHWLWPRSNGIKQILREDYNEIGKIKAVRGTKHHEHPHYFFDEISILIPRQN